MAPIRNAVVTFNEIPSGYPVPGRTVVYDASKTIDPETVPLKGGILIKTLVLSSDPYLRGKMRDPSVESYSPPFLIGEPLYNYGVGRVVRSENAIIKVGDHVTGILNFQEYNVVTDVSTMRVVTKTEHSLPWSVYIGAAGMSGKTAYCGYKEYAKAKKGDTIFVSTGAGAVGSVVIQLAKMDGLKVIASAGTDEKVKYMEEIGADVAFNYKTTDTLEVLKKEGPLDVYWDHVGGPILDAALESMKTHGRIISCGMSSSYNDPRGLGQNYKNLEQLFARSLTIYGFIVLVLEKKWQDEFYRVIPQKLASGEMKYKEDITVGLEQAGEAIRKVQTGENMGKSVIVVAQE
ncbi:alcohol dehydrogenase [Hymenopellis radicata]|nr:alcohol dehydrogenase [Hymenopellis radicata]KAF9018065.1 alcohol dehydrogenase [Hymenopellis radicata]